MTFEEQLQKYADVTVKLGLNVQQGQKVGIRAPLASAPLVRLITISAYKAGARLVDVLWDDDAITLARYNHAPRDSFGEYGVWRTQALIEIADSGGAALSIRATDPDLLKDQDPELVSLVQQTVRKHALPFSDKVMSDGLNWGIVSWPIVGWAAKIFPNDTPEMQIEKLWAAIFKMCRIDQPDPLAAWEEHLKTLAEMRQYLDAKQYTSFKYTAPGTNLTVGLPEHHLWTGGQKETLSGIPFIPNIPTEEVFTLAHRDEAEGVVTATKPLSYAGVLIEDISITFKDGRVQNATASKGEEVLRKLIETDEGSARLGEVALVPHSSPISQTGLLFYNTLYDENAACHLALGRAYRFNLEGGTAMNTEEFASHGGNHSLIHTDFMIGSAEMDIDGVTPAGDIEPVMRAGEYCR